MDTDTRPRSPSPPRSPPRSHSRSRSPVKDRRMSTDEQPTKRARVDSRNEDRKRGQRLFGNLLGTLRKFQDDDKSSRKSEAAKRREQKDQRISNKLRSETSTFHEITDTERELKTLRIAAENAAYVLEHREIALAARHAALGVAREYLHTAEGGGAAAFEATLYPGAVVPVARGPRRGASGPGSGVGAGSGSGAGSAGSSGKTPPALYFLPKVLLPHQEDRLARQRADAAAVIADEADALARDKDESTREAGRTRERIAELSAKLEALRDGRGVVEENRERRESVEREKERERAPERHEDVRMDHDGDMEVEY